MSTKESIHAKLARIQQELDVPKKHWNGHGQFFYRKIGDIFEAVKPLLDRENLALFFNDQTTVEGLQSYDGPKLVKKDKYNKELMQVSESSTFVIVSSTAILADFNDGQIKVPAQAGVEKSGAMSLPQAFGSAQTFARKYALEAMFLLESDAKDPDEEQPEAQPEKKAAPPPAPKVVWVEPSANTQRETLIADGWDGITIYDGKPAGQKYPYVMTRSGNIMLSAKQAKAFGTKAKEKEKEKEMMKMAIESGATESDLY